MRGDLTIFEWPVAENSHAIVSAHAVRQSIKTTFITNGLPAEMPFAAKRYSPLELPGLFMDFAGLQDPRVIKLPTKDIASVEFANKYGLLGGTAATLIMIPNPDKPGFSMSAHGEEYSLWQKEIAAMREAVILYKAVQTSDRAMLKNLIRWENDSVQYFSESAHELIASEAIHPERLQRFSDPYIGPALYRLQVTVNKKLRENVTSARLVWNSDTRTLELRLIPSSLLGCLWLQLANAIAGEKEFRQCLECHTWFDISLHSARKDKKFCNPSCKAAYHRRSVKKASAFTKNASSKSVVKTEGELSRKPTKTRRKPRKA
jgi:hypothetical protein